MYQDSYLIVLVIGIVLLVVSLIRLYNDKTNTRKSNQELYDRVDRLTEKIEERDKKIIELTENINSRAINEFNKLKAKEIQSITKEIRAIENKNAKVELEKWKKENEKEIRKASSMKSRSNLRGLLAENIAPFLIGFELEPRDARFLGNPVDFIVFDGLTEGKKDIKVHFVEVKTGKSSLSKRQKTIKNAIQNNEVYWSVYNPDTIVRESIESKYKLKSSNSNVRSILNMYPEDFRKAMKDYIQVWRRLNPVTSYDDWVSNLDEEIRQEVDDDFLNCIWFNNSE